MEDEKTGEGIKEDERMEKRESKTQERRVTHEP